MDIKHINPFVESFSALMPQLGFESVGMGAVTAKGNKITGTGGLTKTGAGTLTLASAEGNDYSGTTTLSGGTVSIDGDASLGANTGSKRVRAITSST